MNAQRREALLKKLRLDGARIAAHFGLSYRAIEAEHANVRLRYGLCTSDGLIKIRLQHVKTKEPLRYSSLIDTLCHELAHLRHFNHGPEFKRFYLELLTWARRQSIYHPRRRRADADPVPRRPAQTANLRQLLPLHNGVAVFVQAPAPPQATPSYRPALPWEPAPQSTPAGRGRRSPPSSAPAAPSRAIPTASPAHQSQVQQLLRLAPAEAHDNSRAPLTPETGPKRSQRRPKAGAARKARTAAQLSLF